MTALEYIKNALKNMWEIEESYDSYKEFCEYYHVNLNKKELSMWFEGRHGYKASLNIELFKNRCYLTACATYGGGYDCENEEIDEALKYNYGDDLVEWDVNPYTGWRFEFNMEYKHLDLYRIFADFLYSYDCVDEFVRYYQDMQRD